MWDSSPRATPGAGFQSNVLTTRLRVGILKGNQNWSKLSPAGDVQLEIKLPWPMQMAFRENINAIEKFKIETSCMNNFIFINIHIMIMILLFYDIAQSLSFYAHYYGSLKQSGTNLSFLF